jgi:hypothetical protein
VFWEVKQLVSEKPSSSYYDFYKLLLRSSDRMDGGTAADCYIPLSFSTSESMGVGTWHLAVEACSIIKHDVRIDDQSRGMSIISDSFRDPYGHQVIGHLSKSDDKWHGLRMTSKPITRDFIGVNMTSALDGMSSIHVGLRDSDALENLNEPEKVDEWLIILTFYRVDGGGGAKPPPSSPYSNIMTIHRSPARWCEAESQNVLDIIFSEGAL